jgi:hydrogenase maturation protein HypF
MPEHLRYRTIIQGIVQGVGFRPYLFRLASLKKLNGYVANTSQGVVLEIEGKKTVLREMLQDIKQNPPPAAKITKLKSISLSIKPYQGFTIINSRTDSDSCLFPSPDLNVCNDCLTDITNPQDRRYGYPFTNCTNCGPRYSITQSLPYDRKTTSMDRFEMCEECVSEYKNAVNRRFHAQPNACDKCGPQLHLYSTEQTIMPCSDPIKKTITLLQHGKIIAIKGIGGFHLAVDAANRQAVTRLRQRKKRPDKPFAVMAANIQTVKKYAFLNPQEKRILLSPERPIVLLKKKSNSLIADNISPALNDTGFIIAYTPLHFLLLNGALTTLVMTSANESGAPIITDNDAALNRLSSLADNTLLHDRNIIIRNDDSVVVVSNNFVQQIRRSRGIAPSPVLLKTGMKQILACGAQQKNTVCLTRDNHAFLSQYIGELENQETFSYFEQTIGHLQNLLGIKPIIIAHDLHPDYTGSHYARSIKGVKLVGVQHHHAHIASCMAENHLDEPLIGLALDGTGYGTDNTIWGGEIFICDLKSFDRVAHFANTPMPGGAAAIREPWRMALAYLYTIYGESCKKLNIDFFNHLSSQKVELICQMLKNNINSPMTSSLGRLFDSVASLIGLRQEITYESQAAIELEAIISNKEKAVYDYQINKEKSGWILACQEIITSIVNDLRVGISKSRISARFHNTLIDMLTEICLKVRDKSGLNEVAMSGGIFQNRFLSNGLQKHLTAAKFKVYSHSIVPANDGGISLGQAVVANAIT